MVDLFGLSVSPTFIWIGIGVCIVQSATFSGLNLACFSLNRLQLEVLVADGNHAAKKVLKLRKDSNFLLTTILWGNVGINVLLTLLSDSVLAGATAFLFSTAFITFFGEITPQAYFSRNALKMASFLTPVIRFYQMLLFPVAKPCALMLDAWLGEEGIDYMGERDLQHVIRKHVEAEEAEVEAIEGIGALNFLQIDDIPVSKEGEPVDPASIIELPTNLDLPLIPEFTATSGDAFLRQVHQSDHKWVVLCDQQGQPRLVLDSDGFLRSALFDNDAQMDPYDYCHRPILVTDGNTPLGDVVGELRAGKERHSDSVIDNDIILVWSDQDKRVITGADILGRLLKGIEAE
jgi:CBS domain containing-hemolysin-like protein